jgi:quinol monooxygenase YgiN
VKLFTSLTGIVLLLGLSAAASTQIKETAPQTEDYALFVTIKLKPGNGIEYKKLLRPYLRKVRQEKGIWAYKVHQSGEDSSRFELYAHFASKEAHQNHLNQPHTKHYLVKATPLFEEGYPVRRKVFEIRKFQ